MDSGISLSNKIVILLLILFVALSNSFGQTLNDPFRKVDPLSLKHDFIAFRDSLQQLHAGLYRYREKNELDRQFDSCFATLHDSMTVIQYFALISFLVSAIEDGHSSCRLPPESINYLKANTKWFPVQLRFIGKKAYITCDFKGVPAKTEIVSVDHIPINKIREKLFHYLPSDGAIQTEKYWEMNEGDSPFFFPYFFVFGEKKSFTVGYKTNSGKLATTILQADFMRNVQCHSEPAKIEKYLQLDYKTHEIAILTIKTFLNDWLKKTNEDFDEFLQSSFEELGNKNIKQLIIDLRGNGGGNDGNGALLYSYLSSKPFRYYVSLESTTRKFPKESTPLLGMLNPKKNHFSGNVYFLIDGKCFSGTSEFCAVARSQERGKFIGEETGGGYYGNTSGARTTIFLPNTKISVNIPETKYIVAVKRAKFKDRGILPDFTVVPTIGDLVQHKDVQMEFAIHLAGSK